MARVRNLYEGRQTHNISGLVKLVTSNFSKLVINFIAVSDKIILIHLNTQQYRTYIYVNNIDKKYDDEVEKINYMTKFHYINYSRHQCKMMTAFRSNQELR